MRFLGLIGLVLALVIVGPLVKKQLGSRRAAVVPAVAAPAPAPGDAAENASSAATVREQSRQIQQQYQQALDAALQQQRTLPEDAQ